MSSTKDLLSDSIYLKTVQLTKNILKTKNYFLHEKSPISQYMENIDSPTCDMQIRSFPSGSSRYGETFSTSRPKVSRDHNSSQVGEFYEQLLFGQEVLGSKFANA